MRQLTVQNFGPIRYGDIEFGDLTVLVGPQATGKSLFVQLFKAILDAGAIRRDLKQYGFDWLHGEDLVRDWCSLYFGGGLGRILHEGTSVSRDGRRVDFKKIAKPPGSQVPAFDRVLLIPAQRVLVFQDGWPRPFTGYSGGDPYAVRIFSELLRMLMEFGFRSGHTLFPHRRLGREIHALVDGSIYIGATLALETEGMRKRVVLHPPGSSQSLPFSAWSAGQREFTPLLLGLSWLMTRTTNIDTVIIEEPEMGLHPQAVVNFGFVLLGLLQRGYRVILSTHSPVVLDLVWALRTLSALKTRVAVDALQRVFCLDRLTKSASSILSTALQKKYLTYYFHRTGDTVVTEDISSLNPGDDNESIAGWGGLSGFSGRIAQIVGEAISGASRR